MRFLGFSARARHPRYQEHRDPFSSHKVTGVGSWTDFGKSREIPGFPIENWSKIITFVFRQCHLRSAKLIPQKNIHDSVRFFSPTQTHPRGVIFDTVQVSNICSAPKSGIYMFSSTNIFSDLLHAGGHPAGEPPGMQKVRKTYL